MQGFIKVYFIIALGFSSAFAYSYAAAGKELILQAREKVLFAVEKKEFELALKEAKYVFEEVSVLAQRYQKGLYTNLVEAIEKQDEKEIFRFVNMMLVAEIQNRLDKASQSLEHYQKAKVLVVKVKTYMDLLTPLLSQEEAGRAQALYTEVKQAIGNPGLFGVGAIPAQPKLLKSKSKDLVALLYRVKN